MEYEAMGSNLPLFLSDKQINDISKVLALEILMAKNVEIIGSYESSDSDVKNAIDLAKKITGKDIDISISKEKITVPFAIATEKYGEIKIEFTCKFDVVSLIGKPNAWYNYADDAITYKVTGGTGQKKLAKENIDSGDCCGFINVADAKAFLEGAESYVESQLKSAYKGYGNDLNKVVDMIFGSGLNKLLKNPAVSKVLGFDSVAAGTWKIMVGTVKKATIKCPVDVYVYNSANELAAKITDNIPEIYDDNIKISINGDEKEITFHNNSYHMVYDSEADGVMNITISELSCGNDELRTVEFENIPLSLGLGYTQTVDELFLGESDYSLTSTDGNKIESSSDISALHNHEAESEWIEFSESSCLLFGLEYSKCAVCGEWITQTIPKTEHTASDWIITDYPTCTKIGEKCKECTVCHEILETETLNATGHTRINVPATKPTCTEPGYSAHIYCPVCKAVLSERIETPATGHTEITVGTIPATCGKEGFSGITYCTVCNETLSTGSVIPATGKHTEEVTGAIPATCGTDGFTGTTYCTVCEKLLSHGSVIPATGKHTEKVVGAIPALCGRDGYTGTTYCSVCQKVLNNGTVIPATGKHTEGTPLKTVIAPATCTETGIKKTTVMCTVCDEILSDVTEEIGITAHTDADKDGICDDCGQKISGGSDEQKDNICKYCGKVHTNDLPGRFTKFFHNIAYFFTHLFGKM